MKTTGGGLMLGWFWRHRKIRNSALYFLVSCFAVFLMMFSQSSYDCGLRHVCPFLPVWAWLSVPVATESQVGTRHVITVGPRQRHTGKRSCRHKEAQGTMVGRPRAVDVLQNLHGMSSGLFPVSVQVKDQHNRDLRVIMRQDRFARVSPLLASTLA